MKVLYSACQAVRIDVSFSHKLVKVFKPDQLKISRLIRRKKGNNRSKIVVESEQAQISAEFHLKTQKWDAEISGEFKWERELSSLTSTFIPAKEILSNAWNLEAAVDKNNVDFDDTYVDIITSAKIDISAGKDNSERKKYLNILQKITTGTVLVKKDRFYLKNKGKIEFSLVAEGIRKIALLWQLIKNGTLEKGSILFWDEPEANINPCHIPVLVEMLLELQRSGVQIFVSTHDYVFSKYFEVKRTENDIVTFYSFYNTDAGVKVETNAYFKDLKENAIVKTYDQLLEDVFNRNLGD
ncbi:AAA family ATPase [Brevibacillus gelatini]|uniref:AAA family ATPase n=1 Tax=Brevibacillus gelatini TaxID=1655277 RepID=UPI003D8184C7